MLIIYRLMVYDAMEDLTFRILFLPTCLSRWMYTDKILYTATAG